MLHHAQLFPWTHTKTPAPSLDEQTVLRACEEVARGATCDTLETPHHPLGLLG